MLSTYFIQECGVEALWKCKVEDVPDTNDCHEQTPVRYEVDVALLLPDYLEYLPSIDVILLC